MGRGAGGGSGRWTDGTAGGGGLGDWGRLSQLFGAPGFGRCDGTAQSCFKWSLMSSSSVYSDGSSPGFSNLPT